MQPCQFKPALIYSAVNTHGVHRGPLLHFHGGAGFPLVRVWTFAALFPHPLVQSDADEILLPSHGPRSHESYLVHYLEGKKKTFSSEIQGTNLPLELLIRPNTWDADPFSAEPISIQSHPGVPCFESRI